MTDTKTPSPSDAELQAMCAEIIAWHKTGVLHGNALRDYAAQAWTGHHDALQMAERDISTLAMKAVARWGAQPADEPVPDGRVYSTNGEYAVVQWLRQTSDKGGGDPKNSYSWPTTGDAVYVAPQPAPVREPLNNEQMRDALRNCAPAAVNFLRANWPYAKDFARAVEAAHGITKGGQHDL